MYIGHDHISEAITEVNAILAILDDNPVRFVELAQKMEIDGDSACEVFEAVNDDSLTLSLPYVFLIGVVAARKALGDQPEDVEDAELES